MQPWRYFSDDLKTWGKKEGVKQRKKHRRRVCALLLPAVLATAVWGAAPVQTLAAANYIASINNRAAYEYELKDYVNTADSGYFSTTDDGVEYAMAPNKGLIASIPLEEITTGRYEIHLTYSYRGTETYVNLMTGRSTGEDWYAIPATAASRYNVFDDYGFDLGNMTYTGRAKNFSLEKGDVLSLYRGDEWIWIHSVILVPVDDNYSYRINEDDTTVAITGYRGDANELTIPASIDGRPVTAIDASAFAGYNNLTRVVMEQGIEQIGENAFDGCDQLADIVLPASITSIGRSAFAECRKLPGITIPEGTAAIGAAAFRECTGLTSVTVPESVTSMGDSVFEGCTGLKKAEIYGQMTSIGMCTFRDCTSLTEVRLPEGIQMVGNAAFRGCTGLPGVTLPSSVATLGEELFYECSSLIGVTIPDKVTRLPAGLFYGCTSLTSMTIPSQVTYIGESAFAGASLASIIIPASVSYVDNRAFADCEALVKVTVLSKDVILGMEYADVFMSCAQDLTVYGYSGSTAETYVNSARLDSDQEINAIAFASLDEMTEGQQDGFTYRISNDQVIITGYIGSLTELTIPSTIEGKTVVEIDVDAFQGNNSITSVTISPGVKTIRSRAFANCNGLRAVVLPKSVAEIGKQAFANCKALEGLTIYNRTTVIGDSDWDVFKGANASLVLYGYQGSSTARYVRKARAVDDASINTITFEAIRELNNNLVYYYEAEDNPAQNAQIQDNGGSELYTYGNTEHDALADIDLGDIKDGTYTIKIHGRNMSGSDSLWMAYDINWSGDEGDGRSAGMGWTCFPAGSAGSYLSVTYGSVALTGNDTLQIIRGGYQNGTELLLDYVELIPEGTYTFDSIDYSENKDQIWRGCFVKAERGAEDTQWNLLNAAELPAGDYKVTINYLRGDGQGLLGLKTNKVDNWYDIPDNSYITSNYVFNHNGLKQIIHLEGNDALKVVSGTAWTAVRSVVAAPVRDVPDFQAVGKALRVNADGTRDIRFIFDMPRNVAYTVREIGMVAARSGKHWKDEDINIATGSNVAVQKSTKLYSNVNADGKQYYDPDRYYSTLCLTGVESDKTYCCRLYAKVEIDGEECVVYSDVIKASVSELEAQK